MKIRKWQPRYTILLFLWLGWLLSYFDRMVMSVSLPYIGSEFDLNKTTQGWIISVFFISYAAFQIPSGYLADKYGPPKIMFIAILCWSIFTFLTGLVSDIGSFSAITIMLCVRFLFGLGEGAFPASSLKCISVCFPIKERGLATSIQSSVSALGTAIAILFSAAIISLFGWRWVFIFMGIPGVIVAFCLYYYCHNTYKKNLQLIEIKNQKLDSVINEKNKIGKDILLSQIPLKKMVRKVEIWQLASVWFLFAITFWGFTTWLPSYLADVRSLSLKQIGFLGAIPFLFGVIGTIFGGYVSDKFTNKQNLIYTATTVISAFFLYLMFTTETIFFTFIYQCIASFFLFFAMGIFWGVVMHTIDENIMGKASGIVNFGGQIAGAMASPVIGYLVDSKNGSYSNAFLFIIITLITSSFVIMTIRTKNIRLS